MERRREGSSIFFPKRWGFNINRYLQFLFVLVLLALASLGPFFLYFTHGLSFYTFHAISGLMALKHQVAHCFLTGEYPLWNPFMLCGVPFHSGIGVLDPFLISYLFLDGIRALLFSAYLALFCAGLFMYFYLRKIWKLSHSISFLGGIIYLANPFFAATSHESPFMFPAVYLPLILLFYEWGIETKSLAKVLLSGLCLGLVFLSGNLESFYFFLLFFFLFEGLRISSRCIESHSFKPFISELKWLIVAAVSPFLFSAIDLFPTIAMIFDSGRSASSNILENFINFVLVGTGSFLMGWVWYRRTKFQWLIVLGIFLLFSFGPNVLYPNVKMLMIWGQESFQILMTSAVVSRELLLSFMDPRFVFYIQPPIYLFTLSTLIIFTMTFAYTSRLDLKMYGLAAILLVIFPFTIVPNLNHYLLHLDAIAYPRIAFGFFFIQTLLVSYGVNKVFSGALEGRWRMLSFVGIILSVLAIGDFFLISRMPFDPVRFVDLLEQLQKSMGSPIEALWIHTKLTLMSLGLFLRESYLVYLSAIAKFAAVIFLLLAVQSPKALWKYVFIAALSIEVLASWNIYTFQKNDIRYLTQSYPETKFLKNVDVNARVATRNDPKVTILNFYDTDRPYELRWNMPLFWNIKTIEGATLNLSPKLFREFWAKEPGNKFTPTTLDVIPSKIYDQMGMKYLFSGEKITDADFRLVDGGDRYQIYENLKALPRFYLSQNGKIDLVRDGYNELILKSESNQKEFLATTDAFHSNWKVFVDGVRKPVEKTNFYFRGVALEPGAHQVRFVYSPPEFWWGASVSGLFLFILALAFWQESRKRL